MSDLTEEQKKLITQLCQKVKKLCNSQNASNKDGERHEKFLRATVFVMAGIVAALTALTAATISVVGGNNEETNRQLLQSAAFGELLSWLVVGVSLGTFFVVLLQCLRFWQNNATAKHRYSVGGAGVMAAMIVLGYCIAEAGICASFAAPLNPKQPALDLQKEVPCPLAIIFYCDSESLRWSGELMTIPRTD